MLLFFFVKITITDGTKYSVSESKDRNLVHCGIMKTEKQLCCCNQDLSYK